MVQGKRKYERDSVSLIIHYSLPLYTAENPLTALMKDYSYSGLCMITAHPLEEGQEIVIKSGLSEKSLCAVVPWTKGNGDASYTLGAEFRR